MNYPFLSLAFLPNLAGPDGIILIILIIIGFIIWRLVKRFKS